MLKALGTCLYPGLHFSVISPSFLHHVTPKHPNHHGFLCVFRWIYFFPTLFFVTVKTPSSLRPLLNLPLQVFVAKTNPFFSLQLRGIFFFSFLSGVMLGFKISVRAPIQVGTDLSEKDTSFFRITCISWVSTCLCKAFITRFIFFFSHVGFSCSGGSWNPRLTNFFYFFSNLNAHFSVIPR